jgi:aspartyl protease family protein
MLRVAIFMAVSVAALALITPQLASRLLSNQMKPAVRVSSASPASAEVAIAPPASADASETSIEADHVGQYSTEVAINGIPVNMMVDTGATTVVISYKTASRLGLLIVPGDYTMRSKTANGIAAVAPITLREMTVGQIYLGDVKALVSAPNAGDFNLLGMSFLGRLASVEQKSGRLVLRQ